MSTIGSDGRLRIVKNDSSDGAYLYQRYNKDLCVTHNKRYTGVDCNSLGCRSARQLCDQ